MTRTRSHAERRADALQAFADVPGEGDIAERAAQAIAGLGAFGQYVFDYAGGDVWARPQLAKRDRTLVVIAFLSALGQAQFLPNYLGAGLSRGLARAQLEEVILQVGGYAGMPFGAAAMQVATEFFAGLPDADARRPAAEKSDDERRRDAVDVMRTLTNGRANPDPVAARQGIVDALGGVGELAFDFAFGELWSRDELSRRDRSLVVVAILAALGKEQELAFHVPGALNHGVTREEVEEVMVTLALYGGFPRAVEGMRAARAAFTRIDEAS